MEVLLRGGLGSAEAKIKDAVTNHDDVDCFLFYSTTFVGGEEFQIHGTFRIIINHDFYPKGESESILDCVRVPQKKSF